MVIGIDGSRAFESEKTGTERYSWEMLKALAEVDRENEYVIYVKSGVRSQKSEVRIKNYKLGNSENLTKNEKRKTKNDEKWPENFKFVEIGWPRLWTQGGLALRTWMDKLDVLWVPAHTLPVLGNPSLPTVVTIHGIEYEYLPGAYKWGANLHLTWSTRWAVKRASKVVAVSGKTKEDLVSKLGVKAEKIEVVWEGVDLEKFLISNNEFLNKIKNQKSKIKNTNQILKRYEIKAPYILFVGTVQPRKNLVRLMEAFSRLPTTPNPSLKRRGTPPLGKGRLGGVSLVIVGKMGWDYEEILATPARLGIEDRVKFLGFVPDEDLPALYQGASLYVEPSLQEGFGLPVLEAMAAGVPVVAANAGALPEVVGNAGLLVEPESVESIGEGMEKVLRDEKLRKQLVEKGHMRVKEFSWEEGARKLIKIFREVI